MTGAWLKAAFGSRASELGRLARAVNTPLPVRRRIGLASLAPGSGTTTVTAALCLMLDRLRLDRILTVTTASPQDPRFALLGDPHAVRQFSPGSRSDPRQSWSEAAGHTQQQHDLTLTDWGAAPIQKLPMVAGESHALCLVTLATRKAVQQALDCGWALNKQRPVALAVVDATGQAPPSMWPLVRNLPLPAAYIAHAPALAQGDTTRLRERDALELYRLTACLISAVARPRPRETQ